MDKETQRIEDAIANMVRAKNVINSELFDDVDDATGSVLYAAVERIDASIDWLWHAHQMVDDRTFGLINSR